MPTYLFKCKISSCNKTVEKFYEMTEVPEHIECPRCKGEMDRLYGSGGAVIMKPWH